MDASATATATAAKVRAELDGLRTLLEHVWREISWRDVRTGKWFSKLLTTYVSYHDAHRAPLIAALSGSERQERVEHLIDVAAAIAAGSGAAAAIGVTAASITTAQSGGVAAPLVWPLAALGLTAELALRALIHVHLACEIAALYGLRFPPGSEGELVRVYALAVHAEMHETENDPGRGIVERVTRPLEVGGLGKLIAARLVGESLLRNAIPFADVFVSTLQNWRLSREAGQFFHHYISRRTQLDAAVAKLRAISADDVDVFLEGLWFIFIADGRLTGVETALLAHLLRGQGSEDITSRFVSDEASWLTRVAASDARPHARAALLDALALTASVDGHIAHSEAAIVRHAAESLGLSWEVPAARPPL